MEIKTFTFNPFKTNCYLLIANKEVVIIDPSCYFEEEKMIFEKFLKENNLTPKLMIATHGHIDHIFGAKFLAEKYNIPFYINANDLDLLEVAVKHSKFYFDLEMETPPKPKSYIKENDIIDFHNFELKIIEVPGHTDGHIAILVEKIKVVFTGDTLFKGTIGRTDLPGGNTELLLSNIYNKLLTLDDDFTVFPGHGQATTIGQERIDNPFL